LRSSIINTIITSLPAALQHSDCRNRSHPDCRATNPVLAAFSNAVWHSATAAQVCVVLNEAALKSSDDPENAAVMASMWAAYQAAQDWSPQKIPPEKTPATYNLVYSDGATREIRFIPSEIDRWVRESNRVGANKSSRIVRHSFAATIGDHGAA